MKRPYIAYYIYELEALYEKHKGNSLIAEQILYELNYRSSLNKRVLDLIQRIKKDMNPTELKVNYSSLFSSRDYISFQLPELESIYEKYKPNDKDECEILLKIAEEAILRTQTSKKNQERKKRLASICLEKVDEYLKSIKTVSNFRNTDLSLYDWQQEAFSSWIQNSRYGIVEAVTGAGKTHIGLAAMLEALNDHYRVVILVPSITLMNQWYEKVCEVVPNGIKVERMGDSHRNSSNYNVLIAVSNSASINKLLPLHEKGLLIADECHRYGSEKWASALEPEFTRRLGLTATLERSDEGVSDYLLPYFKERVYTLDYKKALEYEVIANFKLAFLGVSFSELEMNRYNQIDTELKNLMGKLINTYEIPFEPFGMFIKEVQSMSQANSFSKAKVLANKFLKVFSDRKDMVASATQKYEALKSIVPSIKTAERTIVFTQTIEATHRAVNALRRSGVLAQGIDSSMKRTERADILSKFKSGEIECIVAPKILDEGVDVPEADLAIILASSKTRRQFIQRIGRVVRKKKDGRFAKIIFLYVSGTMEDPKVGSDESFISIVEEVAQSKKRFTDKDSDDLIDFLK